MRLVAIPLLLARLVLAILFAVAVSTLVATVLAMTMFVVPFVPVPARHVEMMSTGPMARDLSPGAVSGMMSAVRPAMVGEVGVCGTIVMPRPVREMMEPMVRPAGELLVAGMRPPGKIVMAGMMSETGKPRAVLAVMPVMTRKFMKSVVVIPVAVIPVVVSGELVMARATVVMRGVVMRPALGVLGIVLVLTVNLAAHLGGIRLRRMVHTGQEDGRVTPVRGEAKGVTFGSACFDIAARCKSDLVIAHPLRREL